MFFVVRFLTPAPALVVAGRDDRPATARFLYSIALRVYTVLVALSPERLHQSDYIRVHSKNALISL